MEDRTTYHKSQKEFRLYVAGTFLDLAELKQKGAQKAFNELLVTTIPRVKSYITKRLNTAISKGKLPRGKYRADDFVNQLFINVYDHFEEVENETDLYPWLFKKAHQLLEETIVDEEFDEVFFQNIDDFTKPAWDAMEEKFSTDGDGDLVIMEELDDISYRNDDPLLKHVFVEDEHNDFIGRLDSEQGKENIRKHARMVLYHLPLRMRSVYELATEHQLNIEEIAAISNLSLKKVRQLLADARKALETSFYSRYHRINK
jgi:RNA polymerase sigma factor (sigma-70 family)